MARQMQRSGYFWMTMEKDCIDYVRKCHKCQVYSDKINAPPSPLFNMTSPWPFAMWGIDVIGQSTQRPAISIKFILVAIDYFTKWVEAALILIPKMNGVVEAANKNIKKIIQKMAVTPLEVEIPSLRVLIESELEEAEWAKVRYEQLNMISEKRLAAICHHQLYQRRMAKAYDRKVRPREFKEGDLVL
ncbi:uncharacterized protein [Populus alba]|uniref:uncharacterized protein n=1 Tax=Populus alba TaxID=43335 RepID=UPI003CC704AA